MGVQDILDRLRGLPPTIDPDSIDGGYEIPEEDNEEIDEPEDDDLEDEPIPDNLADEGTALPTP